MADDFKRRVRPLDPWFYDYLHGGGRYPGAKAKRIERRRARARVKAGDLREAMRERGAWEGFVG